MRKLSLALLALLGMLGAAPADDKYGTANRTANWLRDRAEDCASFDKRACVITEKAQQGWVPHGLVNWACRELDDRRACNIVRDMRRAGGEP